MGSEKHAARQQRAGSAPSAVSILTAGERSPERTVGISLCCLAAFPETDVRQALQQGLGN